MLKRKVSLVFVVIALQTSLLAQNQNCSFCQSNVIENQKIYEDDDVVILYDYKPVIEGHCLVLPKRHVQHLQDLTDQEMLAVKKGLGKLFEAAQKTYEATSYLIFEKNGADAGQSVPHVHFHFLPRKPNDYWDIGIYARMFFLQFKSPISQKEMDQNRTQLSSQACWQIQPLQSLERAS